MEFLFIAISSGVPVATTFPPFEPPLGTKIDDVVGALYDFGVMFDHDNGIP